VQLETIIWQWGPFSIDIFSLLFFAAVLTGLVMVLAEGRRKRLSDQRIIDFLILALVSGIAGSRLSYIFLFDLPYYLGNPVHFFRLQDGGMSFWGGAFFSLIVLWIWAGRKKLILGRYLDAAAPALTVGLTLGYSGSALNGRVMLSGFPWGILVGDTTYHPDGAYMIVLLTALLFIIRRRRLKVAYEGELFLWFTVGYSLINLGVDFFRDISSFTWIFTLGQVSSLAVFFMAVLFILAGPKVYCASSSLGHNKFGIKSRGIPLLQIIYYLLVTVPPVLFYYQLHQPFIFL
jgi:phosphatidylglycerol---prolipoprotein diacylglyceryl transferase